MKLTSGQKFGFKIPFMYEILDVINSGIEDIGEIQGELGVGKNKIDTYRTYLRFIDVIESKKGKMVLTDFGTLVIKIRQNQDRLHPLLYYKLCRGWDYGGHLYFSRVANNILYDFKAMDKLVFSSDEVREEILKYRDDVPNVKEDDIKDHVIRALNGITDEYAGFGNLGIVKRIETREYEIGSYRPDHLICAYILYDKWDSSTSTMEIDEVMNQEYGLRRIFLLDENDMYDIFAELNQVDLLKIEMKAGLRQIVKNPDKTANDILEEICNESCSN